MAFWWITTFTLLHKVTVFQKRYCAGSSPHSLTFVWLRIVPQNITIFFKKTLICSLFSHFWIQQWKVNCILIHHKTTDLYATKHQHLLRKLKPLCGVWLTSKNTIIPTLKISLALSLTDARYRYLRKTENMITPFI